MSSSPAPDDPFDDLVLDESFVSAGPKEAAAQERIEQAARIARSNDRLRAAGEIADGSGKPGLRRRSVPWIIIGAVIAAAIVVVVLIVR